MRVEDDQVVQFPTDKDHGDVRRRSMGDLRIRPRQDAVALVRAVEDRREAHRLQALDRLHRLAGARPVCHDRGALRLTAPRAAICTGGAEGTSGAVQ